MAGKRLVTCPNCGYTFEIGYARVFACAGCPKSVSCRYVKCPECGFEFPLPG